MIKIKWRPPINFVTIHYAYILTAGLLAFPIIYPSGLLSAVDAYHFGVSASTESGLNTVDLKELMTFQQLYLYFVPMITNVGFINIIVVVIRLWWFKKHLKKLAPTLLSAKRQARPGEEDERDTDLENGFKVDRVQPNGVGEPPSLPPVSTGVEISTPRIQEPYMEKAQTEAKDFFGHDEQPDGSRRHSEGGRLRNQDGDKVNEEGIEQPAHQRTHITFDPSTSLHPKNDSALYIPGPRDRDRGHPLVEVSKGRSLSGDDHEQDPDSALGQGLSSAASIRPGLRRRRTDGSRLAEARSMDRVVDVAHSMFILGGDPAIRREQGRPSVSSSRPPLALNDRPFLSKQVTVGRNSQFHNLTSEDREALGGIEYRSLKLLLKIVVGYFVGGHVFGVICLVPWILNAEAKYKDYLAECGQNETWWAIYSAQTMFNNLGFTLTPDSMITFRDAQWPMFIMSVLAFAGNTFYPVLLRLIIWTMSKMLPRSSSLQDPLNFLLEHPRRCYTLLFPSRQTWALFGILFILNFVDTLLIVVLDLDNPEVADLPLGPRILAAIFQAASARHTGTATFILSEVSPAVQFSLLVMMYISVFPIAITIRASNTYEERSLGIYEPEEEDANDQKTGASYLLKHMQNQLSFDLWYIFLGIFCICIAEADRIMDLADPAFNVFAIFFEVTSAYANVGLSLGHPDVNVSLCGKFRTFSKVVICIMMVRGRHRGLPYQIDRAIMLPDERLIEDNETRRSTDTRRTNLML